MVPAIFCFGGRRLFNGQHHPEANGYQGRAAWLEEWHAARNSQFMVVGSTKESCGNQSCQLVTDAAGAGTLKLRPTNRMESSVGKSHLEIPVQINYRAGCPRAAIARDEAISWGFVREFGTWHAIATVELKPVEVVTGKAAGCIGLDVNESPSGPRLPSVPSLWICGA
jgi:hypothetical protein